MRENLFFTIYGEARQYPSYIEKFFLIQARSDGPVWRGTRGLPGHGTQKKLLQLQHVRGRQKMRHRRKKTACIFSAAAAEAKTEGTSSSYCFGRFLDGDGPRVRPPWNTVSPEPQRVHGSCTGKAGGSSCWQGSGARRADSIPLRDPRFPPKNDGVGLRSFFERLAGRSATSGGPCRGGAFAGEETFRIVSSTLFCDSHPA